jgi:hypothetical protein
MRPCASRLRFPVLVGLATASLGELRLRLGAADSLLGVALWLPALYLAFGVVAARLA